MGERGGADYATFEVLTAVIMQASVFCDEVPCGLVDVYLLF
jgi:hypothetical protein